jgi:xanthine dehydrogenase small subunit
VTEPGISVNGRKVALGRLPAHTTLLHWLRALGLTGAKEGCAEGECGACSVLVARPGLDTPTEWVALNSCLVPVASLDGQEVVTAEGLGERDALHPVQQELAERGGSQCGYCTPGFVCSMAAEYYRASRRNGPQDVDGFDLHAIGGNLCRCTGYRPIRDAARALGGPEADDPLAARRAAPAPAARPTRTVLGSTSFVRPGDLGEALQLLADHPEAVPVAGSTDVGVEVNLRGRRDELVMAIDALPELRELETGDTELRLGAALPLSDLERRLGDRVPLLAELFPQFASRLIRNAATLGGNLATASPIGDAAPALLALDARVVLTSLRGDREVPLTDFFTGYRRTVRAADELVRAVVVPLPVAELGTFHKVAKRRLDDISSVALGIALHLDDGVVTRARIGLGGVAETPIRARATEALLTGRPWTAETARTAGAVLAEEGTPLDDHRASAAYRSAMLGQALPRFHATRGDASEVPA